MGKPSRNHHFVPQSLIKNWSIPIDNKEKVLKLNVAPYRNEELKVDPIGTAAVFDEYDKNSIHKDGSEDKWELIITQIYDQPFSRLLNFAKSELANVESFTIDPNSEATIAAKTLISFLALRNPKISDFFRLNKDTTDAILHAQIGNEYKRKKFIKKNKDFLFGDYQKIWKTNVHYYWKDGDFVKDRAVTKMIADAALLSSGILPKDLESPDQLYDCLTNMMKEDKIDLLSNSMNISYASEASKQEHFFDDLFTSRSYISFLRIPDGCPELYLTDMPLMEVGTGHPLLMRHTIPTGIAPQLAFLPISPTSCMMITSNLHFLEEKQALKDMLFWYNAFQMNACARHLIVPPPPSFDRSSYQIDPSVLWMYNNRREKGITLDDRLKDFYPNYETTDKNILSYSGRR